MTQPPSPLDGHEFRVVHRQCCICDWNGYFVEHVDTSPDCPDCHAPTTIHQVFYEAGRTLSASELGRRGGMKGGPARAQALSKRRRSEIARVAARARWNRKR
jgi:hypothetical protein